MAVDWKIVGLPRWYDCKLGRIKDQTLAKMVGILGNCTDLTTRLHST